MAFAHHSASACQGSDKGDDGPFPRSPETAVMQGKVRGVRDPRLLGPRWTRLPAPVELSEPAAAGDRGATAEPRNGSLREILEERIRDPRTAARPLASLTNALARLEVEEQGRAAKQLHPSARHAHART
jgi:hypothetical protein